MDGVRRKLSECVCFMNDFLPLVNSHMVSFVTENLWDVYLPESWREEFLNSNKDVLSFFSDVPSQQTNLGSFLAECLNLSVQNSEWTITLSELQKRLAQIGCKHFHTIEFNQFMSSKKFHEVEVMSNLVAQFASLTDSTHMVDVGDGKGYLSTMLALEYQIPVLGLDSSLIKTSGVPKRIRKLQKIWKGRKFRALRAERGIDLPSNVADVYGSLYKQHNTCVTENTDIEGLVHQVYPETTDFKLGLIGLHTCGNLSSSCLKLFAKSENTMQFIINVGCCYHLIDEEFWESEEPSSIKGFPLSSYLKGLQFSLGRNARMLSLQAPRRVFSSGVIPTEWLLFRAVLEKILLDNFGPELVDTFEVGRIGSKIEGFLDYTRTACKRLNIVLNISDEEIEEYYTRYKHLKEKLEFYFMIRLALAPVLENIILLDRLLYLKEEGIEHSYILEIFDPVISPRCYAIIGLRDPGGNIKL